MLAIHILNIQWSQHTGSIKCIFFLSKTRWSKTCKQVLDQRVLQVLDQRVLDQNKMDFMLRVCWLHCV